LGVGVRARVGVRAGVWVRARARVWVRARAGLWVRARAGVWVRARAGVWVRARVRGRRGAPPLHNPLPPTLYPQPFPLPRRRTAARSRA
jgi:hypothetical protein